jgi:hypothetical protein
MTDLSKTLQEKSSKYLMSSNLHSTNNKIWEWWTSNNYTNSSNMINLVWIVIRIVIVAVW